MKDDELDPMAPDLRALLAVERAHPAPSAEGKARVAARLDAMLLGPGGGSGGDAPPAAPPAPSPSPSLLPRAIAVFVAGALTGGALVLALREPRVQIVERVVPAPVVSAIAPPTDPATVHAPEAMRPSAAPEPSASVAPAASARPTDSLAAERALLDPARTALGRGDGASALEAVRRHETQFASGKLAEEREAIAVQALVVLRRTDEARARATRFKQRYPGSVLAPAVAAALEAAP